jgi:putative (di)nucleoside polyphosphate hydrolase
MTEQTLPTTAFRANVGILLMNEEGNVLALERVAFPGAWQLPQGGLRESEEPIDAAIRELLEETGISADKIEVVSECPEWLAYELPRDKWSSKTGRGQVQKWFLLRFGGTDANIRLDQSSEPEFRAWQWMNLAELAKTTIPFRRPIYARLAKQFAAYLRVGS